MKIKLSRISVLAIALVLAGCAEPPQKPGEKLTDAITVLSNAATCSLSQNTAPAGKMTFVVTNAGEFQAQFYLRSIDKKTPIASVEHVEPGTSREIVFQAQPGNYLASCTATPTTASEEIHFSVTTAPLAETSGKEKSHYRGYLIEQLAELITATNDFAAAYTASNDETARKLYPQARMYWWRIEAAFPVNELVTRLNAQQYSSSQESGWHAVEHDLWSGGERYSAEKRALLSRAIIADTASLATSMADLNTNKEEQARVAIELVTVAAQEKVSGRTEPWSDTDLWALQANIDGAQKIYQGLRPTVITHDAALTLRIDHSFDALQAALFEHVSGEEFVAYSTLSAEEIARLSTRLDTLAQEIRELQSAL